MRAPLLAGLAVLLLGAVLLAVVVGAYAASRCGSSEARAGAVASLGSQSYARDAGPPASRAATSAARRPGAHGHPARRARRAAPPVGLEIPAIHVRARVVPLGLNPDRTLETPSRFEETGWWKSGARPGDRGPAIVVGHRDTKTGPAVFYRLDALRRGDAIVVVRRDGSRVRFAVQRSERYAKSRFPTARVYGPTRGPALRLITCSGDFNRAIGHYVDNTIVYATLAA